MGHWLWLVCRVRCLGASSAGRWVARRRSQSGRGIGGCRLVLTLNLNLGGAAPGFSWGRLSLVFGGVSARLRLRARRWLPGPTVDGLLPGSEGWSSWRWLPGVWLVGERCRSVCLRVFTFRTYGTSCWLVLEVTYILPLWGIGCGWSAGCGVLGRAVPVGGSPGGGRKATVPLGAQAGAQPQPQPWRVLPGAEP
jgi:hypothetical protein